MSQNELVYQSNVYSYTLPALVAGVLAGGAEALPNFYPLTSKVISWVASTPIGVGAGSAIPQIVQANTAALGAHSVTLNAFGAFNTDLSVYTLKWVNLGAGNV